MNHPGEHDLILHYYGEADTAVDRHLDECADCRTQYRELQSVLNMVDLPAPERAAGYEGALWQRIAPKLGVRRRWWLGLSPRRLVAAVAMACLLVAAFVAGRFTQTPPVPASFASAKDVRERVLLVAIGDHLERSQMVLIELMNAGDLAGERDLAQSLVEANRLYRQTALQTGDAAIASVLDDLERVLLEVAHGPDGLDPAALKHLRERISGQGLLFKVRVVSTRLREQQDSPADDKSETF